MYVRVGRDRSFKSERRKELDQEKVGVLRDRIGLSNVRVHRK